MLKLDSEQESEGRTFIAQAQWDNDENGSSIYPSRKSFTGLEGSVSLTLESLGLAFTII